MMETNEILSISLLRGPSQLLHQPSGRVGAANGLNIQGHFPYTKHYVNTFQHIVLQEFIWEKLGSQEE